MNGLEKFSLNFWSSEIYISRRTWSYMVGLVGGICKCQEVLRTRNTGRSVTDVCDFYRHHAQHDMLNFWWCFGIVCKVNHKKSHMQLRVRLGIIIWWWYCRLKSAVEQWSLHCEVRSANWPIIGQLIGTSGARRARKPRGPAANCVLLSSDFDYLKFEKFKTFKTAPLGMESARVNCRLFSWEFR